MANTVFALRLGCAGRRASMLLAAFLLFALAGCAVNALRIEGAQAVGKASKDFTTSAVKALDDAKAQHVKAGAMLVASDPSCEALPRINMYERTDPRVTLAPLCADGRTPRPGHEIVTLDLRPIPEESLKPTILLIGAVGDYGAALAKVADEPGTDIAAELTALAAKATEASTLANALFKLDIPSADKALASEQAKSALALIAFANALAEEQAKVDEIRRIVAERGAVVEAQIPELRAQLARWMNIWAQGDAQIQQSSLERAYRTERSKADFEQRLAMVEAINASRATVASYPGRLDGLNKGLDVFAKAQADLRRLLAGKLNTKEKKRVARLNQQRMLKGLELMARAIVAFGGL